MKVIELKGRRIVNPINLLDFNYQVDMYVGCEHQCRYCYVQNDFEFEWNEEIGIYADLEKNLECELSDITPQTVYIGMDTDPYQPIEVEFRRTRIILETLKRMGFSVCILTKSDLVLRDMDIIREMPGSSVGFSIAFQREADRELFEKNTISIRKRMKALRKLKENRIENYCLINPVMPFITDVFELIERLRGFTDTIWIYSLDVSSRDDRNWKEIENVINQYYPNLRDEFAEVVFDKRHPCWIKLQEDLDGLSRSEKVTLEIHL